MHQKQDKQQRLRKLRNQQGDVHFDIVHHSVARLDEQLNILNMDRQNQNLEFEEAEQLIRMRELAEEFPIIADKCLPCLPFRDGEVIDNDVKC